MLHINIPNSNLNVSRISMGAGEFGGAISQKDAFYMMDTFCEAGGNLIDTAHIYCDWVSSTKSESEKIIGRWLKKSPYRNKAIISTKGAHPPLSDMHHSRLSRADIFSDCDESLMFLGIDTIDLYFLHRDDDTKDVGEIIESLNELKTMGKIQNFGASNWHSHRIIEANQYAKMHNLQGFCASQIHWSLATIDFETLGDDTLVYMDSAEKEFYLNANLPVMAYSSQAKGYFTKMAMQGITGLGQKANKRFNDIINQNRLEKVICISKELGITVTAVVLGYITSHHISGIAIIGSKNIEQLNDSLTAAEVELPEWAINYLED
jgi:aryl-alcohol dehydrogenase-like predicted oxidoreductase